MSHVLLVGAPHLLPALEGFAAYADLASVSARDTTEARQRLDADAGIFLIWVATQGFDLGIVDAIHRHMGDSRRLVALDSDQDAGIWVGEGAQLVVDWNPRDAVSNEAAAAELRQLKIALERSKGTVEKIFGNGTSAVSLCCYNRHTAAGTVVRDRYLSIPRMPESCSQAEAAQLLEALEEWRKYASLTAIPA